MKFVWSTRGRDWGFRFLRSGGQDDPLDLFESVFDELGDDESTFVRAGDCVGLRFPDPQKRTDHAGRLISHEFVLWGELADRVDSVETGLEVVWPLVADEYEALWGEPTPPTGT